MTYRDTRRRRRIYALLVTIGALGCAGALVYYGAMILFFSERYPDLSENELAPLPTEPADGHLGAIGLRGAWEAGYVDMGSLVTALGLAGTVPGGGESALQAPQVASGASADAEVRGVRGFPWLDRYVQQAVVEQLAAMAAEGPSAGGRMASASEKAGLEAIDPFQGSPVIERLRERMFGGGGESRPEEPWAPTTDTVAMYLAEQPEGEVSNVGGLLMGEPFASRIRDFPYGAADVGDTMSGSRLSTAPPMYSPFMARIAPSGATPSPFDTPYDLSGLRYRTYVLEGQPYISPFTDPYSMDLSEAFVTEAVNPWSRGDTEPFGGNLWESESHEGWLDNPIFDIPR